MEEATQPTNEQVFQDDENESDDDYDDERLRNLNDPVKITCKLCHNDVAYTESDAHFLSCPRSDDERAKQYLILRAHSKGMYFLYLAVTPHSRLNAIDDILRNEWMEPCCGHVSSLRSDTGEWMSDERMPKLKYATQVGTVIEHK